MKTLLSMVLIFTVQAVLAVEADIKACEPGPYGEEPVTFENCRQIETEEIEVGKGAVIAWEVKNNGPREAFAVTVRSVYGEFVKAVVPPVPPGCGLTEKEIKEKIEEGEEIPSACAFKFKPDMFSYCNYYSYLILEDGDTSGSFNTEVYSSERNCKFSIKLHKYSGADEELGQVILQWKNPSEAPDQCPVSE